MIHKFRQSYWLFTQDDADEMRGRIECHKSPHPHNGCPRPEHELDCAGLTLKPGFLVFVEGGSVYTERFDGEEHIAELDRLSEFRDLLKAWLINNS